MENNEERIINVHWEGPYEWKGKNTTSKLGHAIYSIYGSHHLYGRNVLLYIGMTKRDNLNHRLSEHRWVAEEYDQTTVYLGSIGDFSTWNEWEQDDEETYDMPDEDLIKMVEALLIYSHQPAYNQKSKESAYAAKGIRIFNTGRIGQLFPEVSYRYFVDDL